MSNGMKFLRFVFFVAVLAAIGVSIAECRRTGSIDWQNQSPPGSCVMNDTGHPDCAS